MDDIEIMNNDEVVETTTDFVADAAKKNPILGVAVGAVAALGLVGIGCLCKFCVIPKVTEKMEKNKAEAQKKYNDKLIVIDDDSNDSGATE